jgi:G3E family GTPase
MAIENATNAVAPGRALLTVNIITGFLGSGKTSLLKRLLQEPQMNDVAVIINEFGEVGIDHLLVEEIDEEVVLLKSGCICCTIRSDLKSALLNLMGRRERGQIPAFSRLIIETTGLADPTPIVATLLSDPIMRHHVRLGNIITVIDAVNGASNLDAYPESLRQAAVADRLIMSKIDIAGPEAIDRLDEKLSAINPTAGIIHLDESVTPDASLITSDVHDLGSRTGEVARWLTCEAGYSHPHHHDVNRHGDVRAFVLTSAEPIDWSRFGLWLSMLLNRHGGDILRLKGLLSIQDVATPVVIQGVQHLIHRPMHLCAWPDGVATTRIVVIAKQLDPALVERSFRAFVLSNQRSGDVVAA